MILVVGATGSLGGMVTRSLLARGEAVRVLVRPGSDAAELAALGAEPVLGDLKDPESLAQACAGVATVVTTANAALRGGADTVDTVDRQGNQDLIDAARTAGVEHLVFVSALGASEQSPVPLMQAKAASEAHLRQSGLAFTILEPNVFMEVWIGMLIGMPVQHGWPVTLVGQGNHRHSMISIRDVAAFVLAAVESPAARGQTLALGGPEAPTWTEVARRAEALLGRDLDVQYVPPGQPLPGRPEIAGQMSAAFETYETVIDMTATAAAYAVTLTTVDEVLQSMLAPPVT